MHQRGSKPRCAHEAAVPVESTVTGEVLAYWCPTCQAQLGPEQPLAAAVAAMSAVECSHPDCERIRAEMLFLADDVWEMP